MPLDIARARAAFPALEDGWAYMDNAGGSLTLGAVADRVRDHMLETAVQHGASYEPSRRGAARLAEARAAIAGLLGAARPEEVVFSPSTTVSARFLAAAMASRFGPGDEIVLSEFDHESNIGPWMALRDRGVEVRWWRIDPETTRPDLAQLERLVGPRTKLVCMTHCSNILGSVTPVTEAARIVHAHGAKLAVDGVAYAPHRLIDVAALGADYYMFSLYKTYGPHYAAFWGRHEDLLELDGLYHYFYGKERTPGKLEPGNPIYELAWGAAAIPDHLARLGGSEGREGLRRFFDMATEHETALGERLLTWLRGRRDLRIVGEDRAHAGRVPTVSFVAPGRDPAALIGRMDAAKVAIRHGDFHSRRLIEVLDLAPLGVVRVSMAHYNTMEEVDRLTETLDAALKTEERA